eukprot:Seg937.3 transcript_id=Seg937.3/GoldUCD/mRNA.D3Y31 product="BTB/POZ domain-containing protein 2" protein_id=Seg937.3/GoldUCD/D3Y31
MSEAVGDKNIRNESEHEHWQAREPTWKGRLAHLYKNDVMSDITFKVTDKRINAHKLLLASASSVFHAMFYGPVAETNTEIEIIDCPNAEDFKEFLSFVYTEDLSLSWDNLFPIAYLAKKYYIPSLTDECCKFLLDSLTVENVLKVLSQCVLVDEKEMANQCLKLVRVRIRELVRTEEFLKLDLQSLKCILALNTLDIKELDGFLAVDKWCVHQLEQQGKEVTPEGKRELLGNVIDLIRFPTLSIKELTNNCLPSGLITKDQFVDVISFLMSGESDETDKIEKRRRLPFKTSRRGRSNSSILVDSDATYVSQSYGALFKFKNKKWVKGVTLVGGGQCSQVCFIKGMDGTYIKPEFHIKVAQNSPKTVSHLIFKAPVEIPPGIEYTILCPGTTLSEGLERRLFGKVTSPKKSPWNPPPVKRPPSDDFGCDLPNLCKCWIKSWQWFSQVIFSEIDDQPIPVEEELLFHKEVTLQ